MDVLKELFCAGEASSFSSGRKKMLKIIDTILLVTRLHGFRGFPSSSRLGSPYGAAYLRLSDESFRMTVAISERPSTGSELLTLLSRIL